MSRRISHFSVAESLGCAAPNSLSKASANCDMRFGCDILLTSIRGFPCFLVRKYSFPWVSYISRTVASVAKTCYYQIRNIGQIRSCITSDACKILVHALVMSRLDYCNALWYGLPQTMLKRLQRVQNCAARLICRRKKHDHVTPLLKELHWLPIHVWPTYKLLTIAYSVMHGLAPEYLAELPDRHHPRRVLRSASAELFSVPFSQTVRHGDRRFSVAVATLWNQLPNSVRMIETLPLFRTHLKTHLVRGAFS